MYIFDYRFEVTVVLRRGVTEQKHVLLIDLPFTLEKPKSKDPEHRELAPIAEEMAKEFVLEKETLSFDSVTITSVFVPEPSQGEIVLTPFPDNPRMGVVSHTKPKKQADISWQLDRKDHYTFEWLNEKGLCQDWVQEAIESNRLFQIKLDAFRKSIKEKELEKGL